MLRLDMTDKEFKEFKANMKANVLDIEEMIEIIAHRRMRTQETFNKVDEFYSYTDRMMTALQNGKDKDECFLAWVGLIDDMEAFGTEDKTWYSAHTYGLVKLVDEWIKAQED